jgi:predicted dithiol-disulfide oxidoreductase (DUF899 family)
MIHSLNGMKNHPVVSHEEWFSARTAFLAKEKEFTRLRDELSQQRRALPWEKVDKQYVLDGPKGKETLAELFESRSQLVVYHFMFPPENDKSARIVGIGHSEPGKTTPHLISSPDVL